MRLTIAITSVRSSAKTWRPRRSGTAVPPDGARREVRARGPTHHGTILLVVTIVLGLVGIGVVVAVALLAVGRLGELPPPPSRLAPLDVPAGPLRARDVDDVRFAVGVRGYRMDEVDEVLDKLSADLAGRDARIAALEEQLASAHPSAAGAPWEGSADPGALRSAPLGDPLPLDRAWPPAERVDPGSAAVAPWEAGGDPGALPSAPLGDPLPLDGAWPPAQHVDPGSLPPPAGA